MSYINKVVGIRELHQGDLIYLNEYDGINSQMIVNVADSDELAINQDETTDPITTLENVWNTSVKRVEREVESEIRCELMKNVEYLDMIANTADEQILDDYTFQNPTNRWEGARITSQRVKYGKLNIKKVTFHTNTTGNSTIKIFDLDTGLELHTQNITVVRGENTVQLSKSFDLSKIRTNIAIVLNTTNLPLADIRCNTIQTKSIFRFFEFKSGYLELSGGRFINDFRDGLGVVGIGFEVVSNISEVISDNIDYFGNAFGWRMAAALLESSLISDNVNIHTNTLRQVREEKAHEYKKEYKKELDRVIRPVLLRLENTPVIRSLRLDDMKQYTISVGSVL